MIRALSVPFLAGLLALAPLPADARPVRHAKVQPNPTVKAREAMIHRFDARMSRLDALMGRPNAAARTRSAEAGR